MEQIARLWHTRFVAKRPGEFMEDCASRFSGRVQVTTDGHKAYLEAVEGAFGMGVDYAH